MGVTSWNNSWAYCVSSLLFTTEIWYDLVVISLWNIYYLLVDSRATLPILCWGIIWCFYYDWNCYDNVVDFLWKSASRVGYRYFDIEKGPMLKVWGLFQIFILIIEHHLNRYHHFWVYVLIFFLMVVASPLSRYRYRYNFWTHILDFFLMDRLGFQLLL